MRGNDKRRNLKKKKVDEKKSKKVKLAEARKERDDKRSRKVKIRG